MENYGNDSGNQYANENWDEENRSRSGRIFRNETRPYENEDSSQDDARSYQPYRGKDDIGSGGQRYFVDRDYQNQNYGSDYQKGNDSNFGSGHNRGRQNRGDRYDEQYQRGYSEGNRYTESDRRNFGSRQEDHEHWGYDRNRIFRDRDKDYRSADYDRQGQGRSFWDKVEQKVSSLFGDDNEKRRRMDRGNRGKGPKNFKRSDDRIRDEINERLADDAYVDASEIEVTVQNGEVTLSGTVDDRVSKRRTEDIADSVSGVTHIENKIRISQRARSLDEF